MVQKLNKQMDQMKKLRRLVKKIHSLTNNEDESNIKPWLNKGYFKPDKILNEYEQELKIGFIDDYLFNSNEWQSIDE